jgi:hypothetical protein
MTTQRGKHNDRRTEKNDQDIREDAQGWKDQRQRATGKTRMGQDTGGMTPRRGGIPGGQDLQKHTGLNGEG